MNIREAIEQLREMADTLPQGLDSELRVHICNGHDVAGVLTSSVQVDVMFEQHEKTGEIGSSYAVVQGHPHLDEDKSGQSLRPVTMGVDDVVQQWAADLADGGLGTSGIRDPLRIITDPDTGKRFFLISQSGRRSLKLEMDETGGIRYRPGSPGAVAEGCTCDPGRNADGAGAGQHDDDLVFIMKFGCPLHEYLDPPDDDGPA